MDDKAAYLLAIQVTTFSKFKYITSAVWRFPDGITLEIVRNVELELSKIQNVRGIEILSWSKFSS